MVAKLATRARTSGYRRLHRVPLDALKAPPKKVKSGSFFGGVRGHPAHLHPPSAYSFDPPLVLRLRNYGIAVLIETILIDGASKAVPHPSRKTHPNPGYRNVCERRMVESESRHAALYRKSAKNLGKRSIC